MPASALEHRVRTGCFVWTLISLLLKKARRSDRIRSYRGLRVGRRVLSVAIATLLLTLLLLCGDVEANPGPNHAPDTKATPAVKQNIQPGMCTRNTNTRQSRLSLTPEPRDPTLADIMAKLSVMDASVNEKLDGVREDIQLIKDNMDTMQKEMDSLKDHVNSLTNENLSLKSSNDDLRRRMGTLERKTEDVESRSRRNNIIVHGMVRVDGETNKDCEDELQELLTDRLEFADSVEFDRVHRMNTKTNSPVIARCTSYKDKVRILQAKQKLKGSGIFIGEDFTENVRDVRKRLRGIVESLKKAGHRVKMVYDHLIVDGKKMVLAKAEGAGGDRLVEVRQ